MENAELAAEMFKGFNSGRIKFEAENHITGKIRIEDYTPKALK